MAVDAQRRKALTREYKRTPKEMGVYAIRNTSTGQRYVAASRDIQARFNRHRLELKMQSDRSSASLQSDWIALGADAFAFETLDVLQPADTPDYDPTEDLEVLEQLWLDKLTPYEPQGYNQRSVGKQ